MVRTHRGRFFKLIHPPASAEFAHAGSMLRGARIALESNNLRALGYFSMRASRHALKKPSKKIHSFRMHVLWLWPGSSICPKGLSQRGAHWFISG